MAKHTAWTELTSYLTSQQALLFAAYPLILSGNGFFLALGGLSSSVTLYQFFTTLDTVSVEVQRFDHLIGTESREAETLQANGDLKVQVSDLQKTIAEQKTEIQGLKKGSKSWFGKSWFDKS